ncbi:MAG: SDH family Clp fold serine proteinase [Alphaproteobacteria bacterium]
MSALFDAVGFYLDHVAVIGGVALLLLATVCLGVAAMRRAKWRRRVTGSDGITPGTLFPGTVAASPADPQALLRDLSRSRKSHVVVLPWMGATDLSAGPSDPPSNDTLVPFEGFLHHFRDIPADQPIDLLLLHDRIVPPALARRFAKILMAHKGRITAIIPYRAYSGSCLLALAADEIVMAKDAALVFDPFDIKHFVVAAQMKGLRRMSDTALMGYHFVVQHVRETLWLAGILLKKRNVLRWRKFARLISNGCYTHGAPARAEDLRSWGLNVRTQDVIENIEVPDVERAGTVLFSKSQVQATSSHRIAPTCAAACPAGDARAAMLSLQQRRNTKLVSIVHAQGTSEDRVDHQTIAEALKAIRSTPAGVDLDIILHTRGGDALGADQIVRALKAHKGRKTFFVPYNAFSAGTIMALTGDEIFLSPIASLGPIDTQINGVPAARLAYVLQAKPPRLIEDDVLAAALHARDRIVEDHHRAVASMKGNYSRGRARRIARTLNDGYLSHSFPIMYEEARKIGLNVKLGVPEEVFTIVDSFLFESGDFCSVIHCAD